MVLFGTYLHGVNSMLTFGYLSFAFCSIFISLIYLVQRYLDGVFLRTETEWSHSLWFH